MGAGGSALRLQPQVQQAGQRRVPHALRPHLAEAVPTSPLGSRGCSGRHSISSSINHIPTRPNHHHLYSEDEETYTLSVHICLPCSALWKDIASGPIFYLHLSPPGRAVEINLEAPAHHFLSLERFLPVCTSSTDQLRPL